jgi:hypothetical protein
MLCVGRGESRSWMDRGAVFTLISMTILGWTIHHHWSRKKRKKRQEVVAITQCVHKYGLHHDIQRLSLCCRYRHTHSLSPSLSIHINAGIQTPWTLFSIPIKLLFLRYNTLPLQTLNLFRSKAQTRQNLVGMLAQRWWRGSDARLRVGVLYGRVDQLDRSAGRVVNLVDHSAC